jgi:TolB-like protein
LLVPLAVALAALLVVIAGGAWWFLNANRPVNVAAKAPAEAARFSIVVLPFANLSGDPGQDYLVDALTDELTTNLARLRDTFVIARNTAMTFKGKPIDAKAIGKELGVRYVLEGSVQPSGDRMRVNAQLIDAESGNHLWADRFDKPVADLFDMQDEIVARLANALNTQLIIAEARRAEHAPTPGSMDLHFRGMSAYNRGLTPDNLSEARKLFERALALDPGNVDAIVGAKRARGAATMTAQRDRSCCCDAPCPESTRAAAPRTDRRDINALCRRFCPVLPSLWG